MITEIRERVLLLDGVEIPYRLVRRRGRKRLTMKLIPREGLTVHAPPRCPLKEVDAFLAREADWLRLGLQELRQWEEDHPRRRFVSGETLFLLGESWPLLVIEREGGVRARVRSRSLRGSPGEVELLLPAGLAADERESLARSVLERWYRRLARRLLEERVAHWEPRIGVSSTGLSIRDNRSRWGSCSESGGLSFTWKIVMAPPEVVDYLVVHELCHIRHLDHSPLFWDLVAEHVSGHSRLRAWLRKEGNGLYL